MIIEKDKSLNNIFELNKNTFVLISIGLSFGCGLIISLLIIPSIGNSICGFVPISFVSLCCVAGQLIGTIYYIKKHKYAHGEKYEWYQVFNSAIYGLQNVLRVLLVVLLLNIFAYPIVILMFLICSTYMLKKIISI